MDWPQKPNMQTKSGTERQRGGGDTERERQRNISHNITVSYFLTSQLKARGHILYCYSPHSKAGKEEFKHVGSTAN